MVSKIAFLLLLLYTGGSLLPAHAQYSRNENRVWKFGGKAGIDFNGATPRAFATAITTASNEGSASICAPDGSFLFHTDGTFVWDSTDNLMPNGSRILGITTNITLSTSQGSVISPVPDSPGKYFIFSLGEWSFAAYFGKLYCSKVDMSLNNGRGDVDTTFPLRHMVLDSLLQERMTIAPGPGCGSNWLLVYARDTGRFKAYRITRDGLDPNPVVSYEGHFPQKHYRQGTMRVSTDGRMIVNSMFAPNNGSGPGVELYDFDPQTGIVSNARIIDSMGSFASAFSPDNSRLYVQEAGASANSSIYQFDLSQPTLPLIRASKTRMGPVAFLSDARLAPDGKIYFSSQKINGTIIGCISDPNTLGTAAGYVDTALELPAGTKIVYGFPQEVIAASLEDTLFTRHPDTSVCPRFELTLSTPSGSIGNLWSDGSTDSALKVTSPGTYFVSYGQNCIRIDTFRVIQPIPQNWHITVNKNVLTVSHPFDTYQWYKDGIAIPGATGRSHIADDNVLYTAEVSLSGCTDTSSYLVNNVGVVTASAGDPAVRIYPNPARHILYVDAAFPASVHISGMDGRTLIRRDYTGRTDLSVLPEGVYLVRVYDRQDKLRQVQRIVIMR